MQRSDNFQRQSTGKHFRVSALVVFVMAFAVLALLQSGDGLASGYRDDLSKLDLIIQSADASDAAAKVFSKARDQFKDREWTGAERSFSDFIASYPNDKNIDAALFYLAWALKEQSKYQDADNMLVRLIETFPQSNWVDDAKAMRIEIAPKLKNTGPIEQGIADDNEEIRLAALQSLFDANPERGAAIAADILKPGSTSSRLMKESAITLLRESDSKQAALILINVARNETDEKLRVSAIQAMGELEDDSTLDVLKEMVTGSASRDITEAALHAISEHDSARARAMLVEIARSNASLELRARAISVLSEYEDDSVVDELSNIFEAEKNETIRMSIISTLSDIETPRAYDKLIQIARTSDNPELRKRAIHALGDQDSERAVDGLIQLYDAEKDEEIKDQILSALGDSDEKKALRKLMDIVRRDSSVQLRKRALSAIGDSDDPEAIKFLEEILKKN